jgi:hypothetical protein
LYSAIDRIAAPSPHVVPRAQVTFVRRNIVDGTLAQLPFFGRGEPQCEAIDNLTGHLLLDRKDVVDHSIVRAGPEVDVSRWVNKLSGNPQPAPGSADATFHKVANTQLPGDGSGSGTRGAECCCGPARSNQ